MIIFLEKRPGSRESLSLIQREALQEALRVLQSTNEKVTLVGIAPRGDYEQAFPEECNLLAVYNHRLTFRNQLEHPKGGHL